MVNLRRKFYRPQTAEIGKLMLDVGPGHWQVLGPRESDAAVLVIRMVPDRTSWWVVLATGAIQTQPPLGDIDPADFGSRTGVWSGTDHS